MSLYKAALEAIKNFIKTSTSSMTAVPKPLKFLRPHYDELTAIYEQWHAGDNKVGDFVFGGSVFVWVSVSGLTGIYTYRILLQTCYRSLA